MVYLLNKRSDPSLIVFFETDIGKEHLGKVYKRLSNNFFSDESP